MKCEKRGRTNLKGKNIFAEKGTISLANGIEKIIRKAKENHVSCKAAATDALRDLGLEQFVDYDSGSHFCNRPLFPFIFMVGQFVSCVVVFVETSFQAWHNVPTVPGLQDTHPSTSV
ncbi:hypothetical protein MKX01_037889 [Papaver californicum]|nr:hypothetical protein MKX01_037889 [Papaver californicum]